MSTPMIASLMKPALTAAEKMPLCRFQPVEVVDKAAQQGHIHPFQLIQDIVPEPGAAEEPEGGNELYDDPPCPLEYFTAEDAGSSYLRSGAEFGNVAISNGGEYLAIGAPFEDHGSPPLQGYYMAGAAYIYYRENGDWVFQQRVIASDAWHYDQFGCVALSGKGEYLVVGANQKTSGGTGKAYVFSRSGSGSGSTWTQEAILEENDVQGGALYGCGPTIDQTLTGGIFTILVPAKYDRSDPGDPHTHKAGRVFVYTGSGSNWPKEATLTADVPEFKGNFGVSVDLVGDIAAIGSRQADCDGASNGDDEGAVFILTRSYPPGSDPIWTHHQKLCDPVGYDQDWFGFSLALDGDADTLVIGAPRDDIFPLAHDNAGCVLIFTRLGLLWSYLDTFRGTDTNVNDKFGRRVDISADGTSVLIGAPYTFIEEGTVGTAYYFTYVDNSWTEDLIINAGDGDDGDMFGNSLALSGRGDYGFIGAQKHDVGPEGEEVEDAGAAYLFGLVESACQ